ncbi:MAG: GNVR domain-containing protein [Marinilabilia sp.]
MNQSSDTPENFQDKDQNQRQVVKDDEIDLIALAHVIWDERKTIFYTVGVAILIGLMIAFTSPMQFSASASVLPQAQGEKDMGNLGGLASMAGVNLGSMGGSASGIQPSLYPQIINSYTFLNELIHEDYDFEDEPEPVSLYEERMADSIPGLGSSVLKYTLKLPWTLKNAITGNNSEVSKGPVNKDFDVTVLSEEEVEIIEEISNAISAEVDDETGMVTISAQLEEPMLTAQFTKKTVDLLQEYIIQYKTRQVRANLEFIEARYQEKKEEFEEAREGFYEYRDRNRNMIEERTDIRYQELNDDYNIASEVYRDLANQREEAEISVKRETPAFSIIDPVKVPIKRSSPRRSLIMVISVFLGGFAGLGLIFARRVFQKFKEAW